MSLSVFASPVFSLHPLSNSTVLDNYRGAHVANDKALFKPGSFRPYTDSSRIKSGTTSYTVEGYRTQVMKNLMDRINSPSTIDLMLKDVTFIPRFHVNIVSEGLLRKSEI